VEQPKPDPVTEQWYGQTVTELVALNRDAEALMSRGKLDDAAALVTKGQPLANRLVAVPRPTLAAMEAASDLDEAYARILLANHNTGWARLTFQKNLSRWSTWKPQTEDTVQRRKQATAGIAECDRRLSQ
jgi:hypothetical protein